MQLTPSPYSAALVFPLQAYMDTTSVDMTLNLGTAAYMAPELSNIANFAAEFGCDISLRTHAQRYSHIHFLNPTPSCTLPATVTKTSSWLRLARLLNWRRGTPRIQKKIFPSRNQLAKAATTARTVQVPAA